MNKNDPRLIVTLEAINPTAERAWNRSENRDRCSYSSESVGEVVDIPSRETTPAPGWRGSQIQLTFDKKPTNIEKGFVFGSDPQTCDVLLGDWGAGFSRQHFRITFNSRGQVILEDTSRIITCVNYKGEDPPDRNHFIWILFDRYKNIEVTLNKGEKIELKFKVQWPERSKSSRTEYKAHRDAYIDERRNALPSLSQLGVESQQTTALLTAQHSPRQQSIYLTEEELGCGAFGTVYKAVNVSTGNKYAAKEFHSGNWKKEVEILKSVSHEHIVTFVDFSEEQKPLLVMEYLPLGNLVCQDYITEEDNIQILCQGLEALKYLHSHSPPLAHRDIKPENILVQFRTPFVIKLVDFGLAKNDSTLKTFCGTNQYAAPEIWDHYYTVMVDIWSLGVVVLEYGYGLPKPSRKRKGKPWCQDIVNSAEDMEGEGDNLIDFISLKMLRIDYRHRQSASDCLGELHRLGFHAIQTLEIGCTTPTAQTPVQDCITRTTSVTTQPRQDSPSDSDLSSGFYNIGGASETTEVASSNRDLREAVHFYNYASSPSLDRHPQGPTQVRIPQTEDKVASTLSKRRRLHATQSPTADAMGRGQSKRSRGSIPCEAGKQLSKAPNPRQGLEQLERTISSNCEELLATNVASLTQDTEPIPRVAPEPIRKRTRLDWGRSSSPVTEVGLNEIEKPSPKRKGQDPMRALLEGSPDGENEGKAKVTDFDARHVQIKIRDNIVLMRTEDCSLNATQMLMLTNKTSGEIEHLLRLMKESIKVEVLPPIAGLTSPCSWVNFEHGQIICKHFRLEQELQPLIDHGLKLQHGNYSKPMNYINNDPKTIPSQFFVINVLPHPVTVRKLDLRIRVSDICRASGLPQTELPKIKREFRESYIKVGHLNYRGTYVDFWVGVVLCRRYGLTELERELCIWKNALLEPVKKPEHSEAELPDFIEITGFSGPVIVRRVDLRINASHIIKLAGRPRTTLANFRKSLSSEAYDILRGTQKRQGTYVDFDVGIELCQTYGLSQLEKRLYSLKRTSEGPVVEPEPRHVEPPTRTFRQLLESLGSDIASAREESTPSTPTSLEEFNTDGPTRVEDAHEMDSGSGGSFTSSERCSIQQKSQPMSSDRGAKDAVSSRQSECDTRHSSLELESPHSHSAKSVQYEVWDSRSQLSELTEIKPHLRSSPWQTASDYGSFNELFAPI
ncbi:MAG: hypothetical protein M1836_007938 [Candelina mexicana]|nr:MAG: hypothetical protein M1836_007938 [Candelina mexicana]